MKELKTKRLLLQKWGKKDGKDLYEYAKNPKVGPNAGWKPHESIKESKIIIKKIFMPNNVWKIVADNKAVGTIGFEPDKRRPLIKSRELGYSLSEKFWGKGIMTEAAVAVLNYGFCELNLDVVCVTINIDNQRSKRVVEKLGFSYEGRERNAYRNYTGEVVDLDVYSILKDEWEEKNEQFIN